MLGSDYMTPVVIGPICLGYIPFLYVGSFFFPTAFGLWLDGICPDIFERNFMSQISRRGFLIQHTSMQNNPGCIEPMSDEVKILRSEFLSSRPAGPGDLHVLYGLEIFF